MEKKIVRTFKSWIVNFIDPMKVKKDENGNIIEGIIRTDILQSKTSDEKIKRDFVKETGNTCFFIEVKVQEEKREISYEDFIKHSKVVKDK